MEHLALIADVNRPWPDPVLLWTIVLGALCNCSCALLGCYLVLRRLSLLGDAISHAVLPGIALAFLFTGKISGWPIVLGAMALGILTCFLTEALQRIGKVNEDASMGVVFTSLFAMGVIMISQSARHTDLDPGCVLYGLLELAPLDEVPLFGFEVPRSFLTLALVFLGVIVFVTLFWKELKIASFDPQLATAMGLSAGIIHYSLMAMVAGVTVACFEAVGSILVVAMLIVPAATAHLLTDRLRPMLLWSLAVAVLSSVLGYWGALTWNTSVAGMMSVAAGAQFALAFLFAPRHGLVSKLIRQTQLSLRIACEDLLAKKFRLLESGNEASLQTVARTPERTSNNVLDGIALRVLIRKGFATPGKNADWQLTEKGKETAKFIVRSHRLWESYLGEHFELPLDHLHDAAERMEHFITPELQTEIAAQLGAKSVDPHGREIP